MFWCLEGTQYRDCEEDKDRSASELQYLTTKYWNRGLKGTDMRRILAWSLVSCYHFSFILLQAGTPRRS